MGSLEAALALREQGWNVVAAPKGKKAPLGTWKRYQQERLTERAVRDFFAVGEPNIFIITGAISQLLVIDCDDKRALEYWTKRVGKELLERTTCARTGKGLQFYFRLKPGEIVRGRSSQGGDTGKWDIRAEGGGVIAPPSLHPSGRRYEWIRGPEHLQDRPDEVLTRETSDDAGVGARSMLTHLLTHIPEEGGRNVWLAQVAGHYARHMPHQDAYEHLVREAANKLEPPLPENEVEKLLRSIWTTEQSKEGRAVEEVAEGDEANAWRRALLQPAEESGWLVSGGTRILVQIREKTSDGWKLGLAPWMDCDLRVLGVVDSERGRVYEVEIRTEDGIEEDSLPARELADPRRLAAWLANHGCSIAPPDQIWPKAANASSRLLRYMEAQGAKAMIAVPALGWHDESEAFITHEGTIRADGPAPFGLYRPDPAIRGWAPYRYGHGGRREAALILHEILEFHDPEVAAVFGSWWAACLLKPQISKLTSQFPFMALEAASESGKTTGFFSLLLQLSGNTSGQSNPTRAALRDYLSAHWSGIPWVDDLDDLLALGELLRNVTVGGSIAKKGEGNHDQVVAKMRAALVVSGENLGLHDQKALLDRAVLLEVPAPTGRSSLRGDWPQWDDILDLRRRYPDLTDYAGSIVELALQHSDLVDGVKALRIGSGRQADKMAIIRLGARILHAMIDALWVIERADVWAERQLHEGKLPGENVLTLKILPRALERTGWKSKPEGPDPNRRLVATPAFVDGLNTVWFSPTLLAAWWEREPPANRRVDPRVESAEALTQQARSIGLGGPKGADGGRRRFRFITGEGGHVYWRLTDKLSDYVLQRSRGEQPGENHGEDEGSQLFGD